MRASAVPMLAALAAAVLAACSSGRSPYPSPGALRGANVILVTIDTLRQDRLGAYGSVTGLTPAIDRLAASGVRYAHAFSHVPMTLPAHTSILTGLTPVHHGVRNNTAFELDEHVPTIATVLKAAGYRTGAFVGAFVLDGRFGLRRGFDIYDDRFPQGSGAPTFAFAQRRAEQVLQAAGDWITAQPQPFFAWVHLFDPHAPYDAPAEYKAGRAPYDAEVAYADAMLGRFLDRLRPTHVLDRAVIVVTADHGESLGEHGETTHGLFAYQSTLAVPLVVNGTGIRAGVVDAPVGHVDIVPTILDLVGIQAPAGLDGRSLLGAPDPARALYFEALDANLTRDWAPLSGVVSSEWKYIDLPLPELYNLQIDSDEHANLVDRERQRVDTLTALLRQLKAPAASGATPAAPQIDADAAARLRALGYTGGASSTPHKSSYTSRDDPKTLVVLNERFNTALEAFNGGRGPAALEGFLAILGERPDFLTARTSAATVLVSAGRAADAVRLLREAPAEQQSSPELLAKLGTALRGAGDMKSAAVALERARALGDRNPDLFNDLGVVYARLGRAADARTMFHALLDRDPNAAGTWYNLGVLELQDRQPDAAVQAFRQATAADPSYADAWQGLGAALVGTNRPAAIDAWKRAEQLNPRDFDLLFNLATVLAESSHPADAVPFLERFLREAPPDRYAADMTRVRAMLARVKPG